MIPIDACLLVLFIVLMIIAKIAKENFKLRAYKDAYTFDNYSETEIIAGVIYQLRLTIQDAQNLKPLRGKVKSKELQQFREELYDQIIQYEKKCYRDIMDVFLKEMRRKYEQI